MIRKILSMLLAIFIVACNGLANQVYAMSSHDTTINNALNTGIYAHYSSGSGYPIFNNSYLLMPSNGISAITHITGYIDMTDAASFDNRLYVFLADHAPNNNEFYWWNSGKNVFISSIDAHSHWGNYPARQYFDVWLDPKDTINTPYVVFTADSDYYWVSGHLTITSLTYRTYDNINVTLSLTPEKYVNIKVNDNFPFSANVGWKVVNETTGATLTESTTTLPVNITDTSVISGKTYYYSVYMRTNSNLPYTKIYYGSILVPSDAQEAKMAAQAAEQAANNAANAANAVNTIVNNTLTVSAGVVQDSSGTVLSAARQARDAANQTNTAVNNLSNKIDSNQQALLNQLSNLQTSVTNNFNNLSNILPPVFNGISGVNGATATRSSSFAVSLDYSNATQYRYSVDNGAWSNWSPLGSNQISVPLSSVGVHTITVQIRNGSNDTAPTAQKTMTVFKL